MPDMISPTETSWEALRAAVSSVGTVGPREVISSGCLQLDEQLVRSGLAQGTLWEQGAGRDSWSLVVIS